MTTTSAVALAPPDGRADFARAGAEAGQVAAALAIPAIMLLASFAFRAMGLLQAVIDTDEGLYLVQAQAWLRGEWPLISVWDMHPVGAPAMIALSLLAFGDSVGAVRLLGILCVAATGWALFGLVRAAGGGRGLGIGAGLLYIAETTQLRGLATNTEILFAPFIAAAMAVAMGAASRTLGAGAAPRWREFCAAGPLVGAALAIKQVTALEGCLVFALLAFPALWRGALPVRRLLGMAAAYALLCALPTALLALAYWLRGGLEVFLDTLFVAPFRYSLGRLGPWEALQPISTALASLLWPVLLAGIGVANWCRWRIQRSPASEMGAGSPAGARRAAVVRHRDGCHRRAGVLLPALLPDLAAIPFGAGDLGRGVPRPDGEAASDAGGLCRHPGRDGGGRLAERCGAAARPGHRHLAARSGAGGGRGGGTPSASGRAGLHRELPSRGLFPRTRRAPYPLRLPRASERRFRRGFGYRHRRRTVTRAGDPAALVVVDRGWWPQLRPRAATTVTAALQTDYVLAETVTEERGPVEIWQLR